MLTQNTLDQLRTLKLDGMARTLEEQRILPACDDLTFEDRLGLMVDRERSWRDSRRLDRLLRQAKLKHAYACPEDVHTGPGRGQKRRQVASLAGGDWIRQGQGVLIPGPTGVGKTWLACSTAPRLNSALNFLRFDMNTPRGLDRPYRKCP